MTTVRASDDVGVCLGFKKLSRHNEGKRSIVYSRESDPEQGPSSHQLALWLKFPDDLGRFMIKNSLCDV